jgi:hypothetical protein
MLIKNQHLREDKSVRRIEKIDREEEKRMRMRIQKKRTIINN